MSWSVAALVAPLMSGVVIDRWGAEWLWGLCAVIGTVAGVGYWALMRRMTDTGTGTGTDLVEGAGAVPQEVPVTVPGQVTAAAPVETSASALGEAAGSGRA